MGGLENSGEGGQGVVDVCGIGSSLAQTGERSKAEENEDKERHFSLPPPRHKERQCRGSDSKAIIERLDNKCYIWHLRLLFHPCVGTLGRGDRVQLMCAGLVQAWHERSKAEENEEKEGRSGETRKMHLRRAWQVCDKDFAMNLISDDDDDDDDAHDDVVRWRQKKKSFL